MLVPQEAAAQAQHHGPMPLKEKGESTLIPPRDEPFEQLGIAGSCCRLSGQDCAEVFQDRGQLCARHISGPPERISTFIVQAAWQTYAVFVTLPQKAAVDARAGSAGVPGHRRILRPGGGWPVTRWRRWSPPGADLSGRIH